MVQIFNVEPLSIWALFAVLTLLARRDRRLLYYVPMAGGVVTLILLAIYAKRRLGGALDNPADVDMTFLHWILALAVGFAVPLWFAWGRALWRSDWPRLKKWVRGETGWIVLCATLALFASGGYYVYGRLLAAHGGFERYDLLFRADVPRYLHILNGTARDDEQVVHKHPIFALLGRSLDWATEWALGPRDAAIASSALMGGAALFFAAQYFRRVTASKTAGFLLAVILGATPAHLVFCSIPESYAMSALSLILLHWLLAVGPGGGVRLRHQVVAAVFAIGVTLTYAWAALVCFLASFRAGLWRKRLPRWGLCLPLVMALPVILQSFLSDSAAAATDAARYRLEFLYTHRDAPAVFSQKLWNAARGVLLEGVAAPTPVLVWKEEAERYRVVNMGPYEGWLNRAAVGIWSLCSIAVIVLIAQKRETRRPTLWAAALCAGGSLALHTFYGNGYVFLFSCTFTFCVLAIIAHALSALSRWWRIGVIAALGLIVLANHFVFCKELLRRLDQIAGQ